MAKFDLALWKSVHPPKTDDGKIAAAINDWHIMCPENYQTNPKVDPQKMAVGATTAMMRFTAALSDAEDKLEDVASKLEKSAKDKKTETKQIEQKFADAKMSVRDKAELMKRKAEIVKELAQLPKDLAQVEKSKALLAKWQKEAKGFYKEVSLWAQTMKKEEGNDKKNLLSAQKEFGEVLKQSMDKSLLGLTALAKEFDAFIRAGKAEAAAFRLKKFGEMLRPALFEIKPVAIMKTREKVAAKHKVEAVEILVPKQLEEPARKLAAMEEEEEKMEHRLGKALRGEADEEDDAEALQEKAVMETVLFAKKHVSKLKAMLPQFQQSGEAAKAITKLDLKLSPVAKQGIANAESLGNDLTGLLKTVDQVRMLLWGSSSQLSATRKKLKLKDEDYTKNVEPILKVGQASIARILAARDYVSERLDAWLQEVAKNATEVKDPHLADSAKNCAKSLKANLGRFTLTT